jgi:hypothetical protein
LSSHHRAVWAVLILILAALVAMLAPHAAGAVEFTSKAQASWFVDIDNHRTTGTAPGDGTFTLGENSITVGSKTTTVPQGSFKYSDGFQDVEAGAAGQKAPSAWADSYMAPGVPDEVSNLSEYSMRAWASAGAAFFGSAASAIARAADPQPIDTPGYFAQSLTLSQGSAIYLSDTAGLTAGSAETIFSLLAPGVLSSPIATVQLSSDLIGIHTSVTFNSDSRLQFFAPGSSSPITSSAVAALLLGTSSLFTDGGLTSDLPLFDYQLDLTSGPLPTGAALASDAVSTALLTPVPEPATWEMMLIGSLAVVALGVCRRRAPL